MNGENEKRLEAEIDAALQTLPELPAPRTLLPRVMAAVQRRDARPWYRRPWPTWPPALRVASLVALICLFGGICLAGWELPKADAYASTARELARWGSLFGASWDLLSTLIKTVVVMLKDLPAAFLTTCLVSLAMAYALCLGLGAAWVRLAFARR